MSYDVFADLGFDKEEAANLRVRSVLMTALAGYIKESGLTQSQAAEFFSISQPRISDLMNGHIDKFSIDTLVNMVTHAGFNVSIGLDKAA